MGKLSKTLTVLAGVVYSLWKDKKDLEDGIMAETNETQKESVL